MSKPKGVNGTVTKRFGLHFPVNVTKRKNLVYTVQFTAKGR